MRVIISAGGTGGHIYPALAIIEEIKKQEPNSEFLYIGTHNRMEKDIIPKKNIPFKQIEIYGLNKKHIFRTLKYLLKSLKKCKQIIKEFNPDIVIGVGGYVTVPVIISAKKLGYKTFIHEQNSIPGKANKLISKYCDRVGVSFKSSLKYFSNAVLTGNPCSDKAKNIKKIDKQELGFEKNKKLVLVAMGSLGSETINNYFYKNLKNIKDYNLLLITGKDNYKEIDTPNNIKILPFYEGLTSIMKECDLMVSRAGASTLSEIIALQVPSILIPSPYVPNNHQYINALDLVNNKASVLLEEKNIEKLINTINDLIDNSTKLQIMRDNLKKLNIENSSLMIYNEIKEIIKR